MILLDTNVVSELMRAAPAPEVLAWFRTAPPEPLALSAITAAELRYGIACLPKGRRKSALDATVTDMLDAEFAGLVLPFGRAEAEVYGELAARHRRAGRTVGQPDLMIAATALVREAGLATRNIRDFAATGLVLHDLFAGQGGRGPDAAPSEG